MWSIDAVNAPAGEAVTLSQQGTGSPIPLGQTLGPKGAQYELRIGGLGRMYLVDIGDIGGKGVGPYGVDINGGHGIWYYDGAGHATIAVTGDGQFTITGGANPKPVTGPILR